MKTVIAVDESQSSHDALNWALDNLYRKGDEVTLMTVPHREPIFAAEFEGVTDLLPAVPLADAESVRCSQALLNNYKELCNKKNVSVETHLAEESHPASAVVAYVEKMMSDLLVLGSRQLGVLPRFLVGSVGDFCAHNCHCPVVIYKQQAISQKGGTGRKILLCIDDSTPSDFAYEWTKRNLLRAGDDLIILSVETSNPTQVIADAAAGEPPEGSSKRGPMEALSETLIKASTIPDVKVSTELLKGSPGASVVEYANKINPSCVVVGSKERGTLGRAVFGSVGDYICHNVSCPVVVCKQPAGALFH